MRTPLDSHKMNKQTFALIILSGGVAVSVCLRQPYLQALHHQVQVLGAFVLYLTLQKNVFTFANEAIIIKL